VGAVAHRACNQEIEGLTPSQVLLHGNCRQVSHTFVPVSPSSIIWYRLTGSDAFYGWEVTAGLAEGNGSLLPAF